MLIPNNIVWTEIITAIIAFAVFRFLGRELKLGGFETYHLTMYRES